MTVRPVHFAAAANLWAWARLWQTDKTRQDRETTDCLLDNDSLTVVCTIGLNGFPYSSILSYPIRLEKRVSSRSTWWTTLAQQGDRFPNAESKEKSKQKGTVTKQNGRRDADPCCSDHGGSFIAFSFLFFILTDKNRACYTATTVLLIPLLLTREIF